MPKTWMPTAAGILAIVGGGLDLIGVFLLTYALSLISSTAPTSSSATILPVLIILGAILGLLAVVGGLYALQRKVWGLALAGSIAALFASWPLGIPAIVFTVMSKKEFE